MPYLCFESRLRAARERVWAHASTLAGVNAELHPLHMSGPKELRLRAAQATGRPLFYSVVTLYRMLPLDLHALTLLAVDEGVGFHESSRSLLEQRWSHVRRLEDLDHGTRVIDMVDFSPRFLRSLTFSIVGRVFARRHAYLRRAFGEL